MSHLCLLDFNDTLFPTTEWLPYFCKDKFINIPDELKTSIKLLDSTLEKCLRVHLMDTRFVCYTRSDHVWVSACLRHIPLVGRLLRWYIPICMIHKDNSPIWTIEAWMQRFSLPKEFSRISCISKSDSVYMFEKNWWFQGHVKHFFCLMTFKRPSTHQLVNVWKFYTIDKEWYTFTNTRSMHKHCVID